MLNHFMMYNIRENITTLRSMILVTYFTRDVLPYNLSVHSSLYTIIVKYLLELICRFLLKKTTDRQIKPCRPN